MRNAKRHSLSGDTACVDACPVDVIHPRTDEAECSEAAQLYIFPDDCIDCAACVPVCPVSAIFLAEELPEKWAHYAKINADWYAGAQPTEPESVTVQEQAAS